MYKTKKIKKCALKLCQESLCCNIKRRKKKKWKKKNNTPATTENEERASVHLGWFLNLGKV